MNNPCKNKLKIGYGKKIKGGKQKKELVEEGKTGRRVKKCENAVSRSSAGF